MKNKLETYVKTYEEPEVDDNGKLITKIKNKADNNDKKQDDFKNEDGDAINDEEDIIELKA